MKHEIHQTVELQGRYKAIKHKGHKFDDKGELIEFGEVIEETGWGKNIITLIGINALLSGSGVAMWTVAGTGNATPSEANTVLASYAGKQTTRPIALVVTRQTNPATELYIKFVERTTFNPGAFGGSAVNIAEAGKTFGQPTLGSVNSSTTVFSRGLLVDSGGSPTTISVAPDEYLDIVWEFTIYVPYDTTGTVSLTIDGVPTDHTYFVRPIRLDGIPGPGYSWGIPMVGGVGTSALTISNITTTAPESYAKGFALSNTALTTPAVTPTGAFLEATSHSSSAYVANSKQRQYNAVWSLTAGNAPAPGVTIVTCTLNWPSFQVSYSPPIAKTSAKQLNLSFMLSFANR